MKLENSEEVEETEEDESPYKEMPGKEWFRQKVEREFQDKKKQILREMAGDQSEMEAML